MGGTLGGIALVFGLGAILGKLIADAGGAQRIAMTLIDKFGEKRIQWAVVVAGFVLGIALFFEVGLVLLIPIVYQISKQLKIPLDRKSTRLNSSHVAISYAVFCLTN